TVEFTSVEVDDERRRPDMGDVDEQDGGHPGPVGRLVQQAGPDADREQDHRQQRAAEERAEVDSGGEQPAAPQRSAHAASYRIVADLTPWAARTSSAARTPW